MEDYERLELELKMAFGGRETIATSNGTAALHLALEALQLPLGTGVLVPEFTMIACARAVVMAGLVPIFVDCNDSLLMETRDLHSYRFSAEKINAIMPVHIYGRRCEMGAIRDVAARYGWDVIEDMAEFHGYLPSPCSDAACWSFYKNKVIAGEEGGAIAFKSKARADLARQLRSLGFTDAHDFSHVRRGVNARLSNANARPIIESLGMMEENLKRRRHLESIYNELIPQAWRMPARESPWVYDLRIPGLPHWKQDIIVKTLNGEGIAARHGFKPMSMQNEFRAVPGFRGGKDFRSLNAYRLSAEVLYLPLDPRAFDMPDGGHGVISDNVARLLAACRQVEIPIPT